MINQKIIKPLAVITFSQLLTACNLLDDDNDKSLTPFDGIAVIQSSGSGESHVEFTDGISKIESGFLPKTATDYAVFSNGEHFYHLGKSSIDTLQKYHIDNPEMGFYPNNGFSLMESGDTTSANPHELIFLNESTGVITRYGKTEAWVVNLNATDAADFIIKKLDLSHHTTSISDADSDPEMDMAFINNDKLFITLQNLDGWSATTNAKIAVFNTNDWQEIDTNPNEAGVQAISLSLKNHQSGAVFNNKIYLGSLVYGATPTGGIEVINTDSYNHSVVIDDIAVNGITVNSEGHIFFSGYAAWEDNTLYKLNTDNSYSIISNELSGINITSIASPDKTVWLATNSFNDENKIIRLNASLDFSLPRLLSELKLSEVITAFKPIGVAFLDIKSIPEGNVNSDENDTQQ